MPKQLPPAPPTPVTGTLRLLEAWAGYEEGALLSTYPEDLPESGEGVHLDAECAGMLLSRGLAELVPEHTGRCKLLAAWRGLEAGTTVVGSSRAKAGEQHQVVPQRLGGLLAAGLAEPAPLEELTVEELTALAESFEPPLEVEGTGKDGRVLKADLIAAIGSRRGGEE